MWIYDLSRDPHELANLIDDPATAPIRNRLHRELLEWMNRHRDPFRGLVWDRRSWGTTAGFDWGGKYRPRPDDGMWPGELSYATGKLLNHME